MRHASHFGRSPVAFQPFSPPLDDDDYICSQALPPRAPMTVKKCVSKSLFTGEGGAPARVFKFKFSQQSTPSIKPPRTSEEGSDGSRLSSPLTAADPPFAPDTEPSETMLSLLPSEKVQDCGDTSPLPSQPTPMPMMTFNAPPPPQSARPKRAKRDLGLGYCANGTNQRTSGTTQRLPKAKAVRAIKVQAAPNAINTPAKPTVDSTHAEAASHVANEAPRSGKWLPEEDVKLMGAMDQSDSSELGRWTHVAILVPGRTPKQCRERWTNQARPPEHCPPEHCPRLSTARLSTARFFWPRVPQTPSMIPHSSSSTTTMCSSRHTRC